MSRVCPACGKVLPEIPLPVCAHCGARLEAPPSPPAAEAPAPELTLPVTGFETSAELLERFFDPPVRYMPTATNAALLMLSPWLLPAGGGLLAAWDPRSANPAVLAGLFAAALVLTVWLAATRTPGEPAAVEIVCRGGEVVRIPQEFTAGAAIHSLRNLAALIELLREALRREGATP